MFQTILKTCLIWLSKKLLSNNQYSFKPGRSTDDASDVVTEFLSIALDRGDWLYF